MVVGIHDLLDGEVGVARPVLDVVSSGGLRHPVVDAVHAADRAEHHHRLVMSEFEGEVASDVGLDHIAECTRCPLFAVVQTGTGRGADVPGATGPLVGPQRREVTEAGEELGQCVLVVLGELPVQGPFVHSLGEQLGDIAVGVRLGGR